MSISEAPACSWWPGGHLVLGPASNLGCCPGAGQWLRERGLEYMKRMHSALAKRHIIENSWAFLLNVRCL